MSRLRNVVPFHSDESVPSLVSRIAAANHVVHARRLGSLLGFNFERLVRGSESDLARLADLTGLPIEDLMAGTVASVGSHHRLRGQLLTRSTFDRDQLRYCPHCVEEDLRRDGGNGETKPYGRLMWHVVFLKTCPAHGTAILTVPKATQRVFRYDFRRMLQSRKLSEDLKASADLPMGALDAYVLARINGDVGGHPWLDSMPLYAAGKVTQLVGATMRVGTRMSVQRLNDRDWSDAGTAGFQITSAGPDAFAKFIQEAVLHELTKIEQYVSPAGVLGRWYRWLMHESDDPTYDEVRGIIHDVCCEILPLAPGSNLFGEVKERRLHNIPSLAEAFNMKKPVLAKWLVDGGFVEKGKLTSERYSFEFLPAKGAEQFVESVESALLYEKARDYINAPLTHWKRILSAGYIKSIVFQGKRRNLKRFSKHEIDRFLQELSRNVNPSGCGRGLANLRDAILRANVGVIDVIETLMKGILKNTAIDHSARGYLRILIDIEEVRDHLRQKYITGLSPYNASVALRTNPEALKALIEGGFLAVEQREDKFKRKVVDPDDIEHFRKEYVSLFDLSAETGIHFMRLGRLLREKGVTTIVDPEKARASFYRRSDINL